MQQLNGGKGSYQTDEVRTENKVGHKGDVRFTADGIFGSDVHAHGGHKRAGEPKVCCLVLPTPRREADDGPVGRVALEEADLCLVVVRREKWSPGRREGINGAGRRRVEMSAIACG